MRGVPFVSIKMFFRFDNAGGVSSTASAQDRRWGNGGALPLRAILSSMARSSAIRIEVDEDIRAIRAAPMSKAATSPFVVGSAMATGRARSESEREERHGDK